MSKAVFVTKVSPVYDDLPETSYHFPRTYLNQVSAAVGDWIVYYEPRRTSGDPSSSGGRQAYFAMARLDTIVADPSRDDHFYGLVSQYQDFLRPVPFAEGGTYYEGALRKTDGTTNRGAFGRAVRTMPDAEYDRILVAGFARLLGQDAEAVVAEDRQGMPAPVVPGLTDTARAVYLARAADPEAAVEAGRRPLVEQLVRRAFRDRAFAGVVKAAYADTCAITGLRIINGGGRSEVQAAHIRPVAENGPDSIRNGLALSGTVHWMFDRGLLSVDDDFRLLVAKDRLPDTVCRLLPAHGRLSTPERADLRPHPAFLKFHRESIFKG